MTVGFGVILFQIALRIYLVAALCYVADVVSRQRVLGKVGSGVLLLGLLAHTASLVVRTIATRQPPFLNLYEYMLSLTWSAVVVYLVLEWVTRTKVFGFLGVPLIAVSALVTNGLSAQPKPIPPALMSVWRVPHIGTAAVAYAAFGMAFCIAIMYLMRARGEADERSFWASRLPSPDMLDRTIYRTIAFGFLMQTALILTGALWAQESWARYWGWDNKETWSLITWLVYAAYLHTRTIGWKGSKSAVLAIIGFAVAMFTLFGVSYLLSGLHSYA